MKSLNILVVADDLLARTGLATLISEKSDHQVVGQVSGSEFSSNLAVFNPDLVIWDMGWEPSSAQKYLTDREDVEPPVIALIAEKAQAADTWNAGARGLFLRSVRFELLLAAFESVAKSLIVIDPMLGETLLTPRERLGLPPIDPLTTREAEVLQLLAQGLSNKELARRLNISESTIKFHINAILSKLGAQSRTDAVVRATRLGLVLL